MRPLKFAINCERTLIKLQLLFLLFQRKLLQNTMKLLFRASLRKFIFSKVKR